MFREKLKLLRVGHCALCKARHDVLNRDLLSVNVEVLLCAEADEVLVVYHNYDLAARRDSCDRCELVTANQDVLRPLFCQLMYGLLVRTEHWLRRELGLLASLDYLGRIVNKLVFR